MTRRLGAARTQLGIFRLLHALSVDFSMNHSTVEPAYLIAPVPGVWGWSFNLCLFASGIFSDLLLIKVCLTLGFQLHARACADWIALGE